MPEDSITCQSNSLMELIMLMNSSKQQNGQQSISTEKSTLIQIQQTEQQQNNLSTKYQKNMKVTVSKVQSSKTTKNSSKKISKPNSRISTDNGIFRVDNISMPVEVLCNLAARFILSMPEDEINDPIRICFQMELAFWYYNDTILIKTDSKLPTLKLRMFAYVMFNYIDSLKKFLPVFDEVIGQWIEYKFSIPTYGAILLDSTLDYVLLVQGFGSGTWGFPKGKQNHSENPMLCACREVFEEIGYPCLNHIRESDYLERKVHNSRCRLYILTDVATDYEFKPHVVNEIRDIQWFKVNELPVKVSNVSNETFANKFYSVSPFVYSLKKWIAREKKRRSKVNEDKNRRTRYNSVGENAQKSDDSGTNSPYHMVENSPDIGEGNNVLNALFSASTNVQSEKEMHTRNVYHADLQQNFKSFSEKKTWPELWQSLVNHYNDENDEKHSSKIDYDLKSKLSASTSASLPLRNASSIDITTSTSNSSFSLMTFFPGLYSGDNSNNNGSTITQPFEKTQTFQQHLTSSNNDNPEHSFNDKLNFLFNIGSSGEKRNNRSVCSTPINNLNNSSRKLFPSPETIDRFKDLKLSPFDGRISNGFDKSSTDDHSKSYTFKGLSNDDAQTLSEPMARFLGMLNGKRG